MRQPVIIAIVCALTVVYLFTFVTWEPVQKCGPSDQTIINRTIYINQSIPYCVLIDYNISEIPGDAPPTFPPTVAPTTAPTEAPTVAPVVCPTATPCPTAAPCPTVAPTTPTTTPTPTKTGPEPFITHKLNREKFDKNFDELYDKYIQYHTTTLANEKAGTAKGKYVYVTIESGGGLGNRLRPIVSGFILALITNRVLVIDWQWTEKLQDWIDPGFELMRPSWLNLNDGRSKITTNMEKESAIPALFENLTLHFQNHDVINLNTINYPSVLFYDNPYHKEWLLQTFAYNAYTIIVRRLYKLSALTQKIVDDFKAQNFGEYNVGIQLRASRSVWNKDAPPLYLFWDMAVLLQEQSFPFHKNKTKFFLATDTKHVQDDARAALGSAVTFVDPFRERYSKDAELYAFIDHVLLGECDQLVVTFTSTYGNIAVGWKSAPGIMIYHDGTWGTYSVTEPFFWDTTSLIKIFEERKLPFPPLLRWQVRAVYFRK